MEYFPRGEHGGEACSKTDRRMDCEFTIASSVAGLQRIEVSLVFAFDADQKLSSVAAR